MKITWHLSVTMLWSFGWRALLYSVAGGVALGVLVGAASALLGWAQTQATGLALTAGYVACLPALLWAMKHALERNLLSHKGESKRLPSVTADLPSMSTIDSRR